MAYSWTSGGQRPGPNPEEQLGTQAETLPEIRWTPVKKQHEENS